MRGVVWHVHYWLQTVLAPDLHRYGLCGDCCRQSHPRHKTKKHEADYCCPVILSRQYWLKAYPAPHSKTSLSRERYLSEVPFGSPKAYRYCRRDQSNKSFRPRRPMPCSYEKCHSILTQHVLRDVCPLFASCLRLNLMIRMLSEFSVSWANEAGEKWGQFKAECTSLLWVKRWRPPDSWNSDETAEETVSSITASNQLFPHRRLSRVNAVSAHPHF